MTSEDGLSDRVERFSKRKVCKRKPADVPQDFEFVKYLSCEWFV